MPLFLIPWLVRGVGVLVVLAALWGAWYKVNHWCNAACVVAVDMVAERDASIAATQARATALALLWSAQVDKTENATHQAEVSRNATFAELQKEAARTTSDKFDRAALGLLQRSYRASRGETSRPPSEPPETTSAHSTAVTATEFVVSLYAWIGECKARVDSWSEFYLGLQRASQ